MSSSKNGQEKSTGKERAGEVLNGSTLFNADNIEVMKMLPSNSIDSVVTDPPYGISMYSKKWDTFESALKYQQWCFIWATELYRIMKPGAHLIAFSSPRFYHRLATGIEDAGFEIRDQLQWLYSQGFPKSRNISNDIDRFLGKKGKVVGKKNCSRKGIAVAEERTVRAAGSYGEAKEVDILDPCTEEAKKWSGWKTALKPSNEPIVLARKPLSERSIARNILKWDTAGININACRIGDEGGTRAVIISKDDNNKKIFNGGISSKVEIISSDKGRFPSNTIISDQVAEILEDKAKFFYCPKISRKERNAGCEHLELKQQNCEGKQRTINDRCAVCKKKFIGSDKTRCQCPKGDKKTDKTVYKNKNNHPTVKPVALMEYLVKLVTPKGGVCLDIFMGSGSTGCACSNLDIDFIGVERESEYFEIAKARIQHWQNVKKVA